MSCDSEEIFGEIVGYGAQATVYAKGECAVKLYRDGYPKANAFAEAYMMACLEQLQFPSPNVYEVLFVDGRYGVRMDRVKGEIMSEALSDPEKLEDALHTLVYLQCRLQKYDIGVYNCFPNLKERFHGDIERSERLSTDLKQELLELLDKLPDGQALCHCDFHGANVFFDGAAYTIIDLLQISKGDPAADAACSYVSYCFYNQDLGELYLSRYCDKSGISKSQVQQWLRVYAGTILGQVPEQYTPILEQFIGKME
jgi:aminoglycoside phosphotransferase